MSVRGGGLFCPTLHHVSKLLLLKVTEYCCFSPIFEKVVNAPGRRNPRGGAEGELLQLPVKVDQDPVNVASTAGHTKVHLHTYVDHIDLSRNKICINTIDLSFLL